MTDWELIRDRRVAAAELKLELEYGIRLARSHGKHSLAWLLGQWLKNVM